MSDLCTSEQAIAATSHLNNSFGGYPMTPDDRRPYLRLFATFTPEAVRGAIDHLARSWTGARRPSANDVAQVVAMLRPETTRRHGDQYLDEIPSAELTPLEELPVRVAEMRTLL